MVFIDQLPVTPAGKPLIVAPVAPVVLYVIVVMAELTQVFCWLLPAAEVSVMVLLGLTKIDPVVLINPQPPFSTTEYVNIPEITGVPLIVMVFEDQLPVTPLGNPVMVAPVAPVVV